MKKSIGPDSIPNWILKDFASILAPPITSIFNASISQGHVPTLWKSADVIPVPKVPKPVSIDNDLRPIPLTAVLSKILEGHVFDWLYPCFSALVGGVSTMFKGVSTMHALVHLLHHWLQATDSPKPIVRSCMIDFSKSFDRIDHNIVLLKLEQMKIPAILLKWCENFLRDRKQRVKLGILNPVGELHMLEYHRVQNLVHYFSLS
jgi:hypothetical protein